MNSKVKGIICCLVVVACLGGMLAFLELSSFSDSDSSSSSGADLSDVESELTADEEAFPLMDVDIDKVTKVTFKNESGEYHVVKASGDDTANSDAEWVLEELKGIKQSSSIVKATVNIASSLTGKKIVEENAQDLSKYGFDNPLATITVSVEGQEDRTFLLGIEIPTGGYYYLCEEGRNTVYTALDTNVNYYMQNDLYYCSTALVHTPSDSSWPSLERLTIKRSDLSYDMVFVTIPDEEASTGMVSSQAMIKPVYQYLDITNSADVTHGIWGLSSESAVVAYPTEEDFAEYGLDKPLATVILDCDTEDYTLKVGNPVYQKDDNDKDTSVVSGYYCYINAEGTDCIYIISAEECVWATVVPGDIISGLMTFNYIMDLDSMTVTTADKTYDFDIYAVDKEEAADDILEVSVNSKDIDADLFKSWYVFWLDCPTNETYFEPLDGEKEYMTVTMNMTDGSSQTVKFYTTSNRRLIVELDGDVAFKVPTGYAETLIKDIERIINGESVIDTY